jgi:hypothetical protein
MSFQINNNKEYRIFGIKRIGNHAIINWIFTQIQGITVFLNNCYIDGGNRLKLYDGVGRIDCKNIDYWHFKQKLWFWERNPFEGKEIVTYSKKDKRFKSDKLKLLAKEAVIISFENRDIATLTAHLDNNHERLLGNSRQIFSVVIMRDPFNLFASNYQKWGKKSLQGIVELWKTFAQKFIEYQESNDKYLLGINYNEWFANSLYREKIAKVLDLPFNDQGINTVREFSGGSSFDGFSPEMKAQDLDVLNRWQAFKDDPFYRSLFEDQELWDLSFRIFGNIPQTTDLTP